MMYDCSSLDEGRKHVALWVCVYRYLTNIIHSLSPGILGVGVPSVHLPGHYLIKLALILAQKLW